MKKRAISYTRFSSHRQHGGTSLERQQTMIAEWLERHPEYEIAETTYSDLAKSGYHGEHAAKGGSFGKLLDAVEAGKIKAGDVVLVEAIDRTARLPALQMLTEIIGPILRAGITIWTLDDGAEYTTESLNGGLAYLLVSRIQAAHGYSKTLSRRVTASYDKRREQARDGKQIKRWTPVWLTTEGKVIERIAVHVKTAFELYVAGVGKASIAVRMRTTGEPELAKASGPGVEGWLRNKTAIGYWNDIPGAYDPIIDQDLFYRAQQRGKEAKTTRPVKTAKNFLVGLVVCGHCGKNFIMQNKFGVNHSMRCQTRQAYKAAGCPNSKNIPKPVLDWLRLKTSFAAIQTAFQRQQLTTNQKRILELESQVEAVTRKITDLASAIQTVGLIPEVLTQLEARTADRDALQAELLVLERTEGPVDAIGSILIEHDLLESDPVKLNALLRGVDYRITVFSDGRMLVNSPEESTPWVYIGADGHKGLYRVEHDGAVIEIPRPTGDTADKYDFLSLRVNPVLKALRTAPKEL